MSSLEIDTLLKENNYYITVEMYQKIIRSSQIVCISWKQGTDYFEVQTYDGYKWLFEVERKHR